MTGADLHDELTAVVRDLAAQLRVLQGFGVRSVARAAEPEPLPEPQPETRPDNGAEGRPARSTAEPARVAPTGREQAHMFAPPPTAASQPAAPAAIWRPNPLGAGGAADELEALRRRIGDCTRCPLSKGRRNVVFGEGDPVARLALVGEGPGGEEDRTGRPFVGPAGQLLEKILAAMGLTREQVYICNVVKCRPPGNRTPEDAEMRTCGQFLEKQLQIVHPRHILCLGGTAARYLLSTERPMGQIRGRFFDHPATGARIMPTYHPAYLLRNEGAKRSVWEDVKRVMAEMAEPVEEGS